MRIYLLLFFIFCASSISVLGQVATNPTEREAAYTRTIYARSEKIVGALGLSDSLEAKHIISVIADQYGNLNTVYTEKDDQIKIVKQKGEAKEVTETELKKIEDNANNKIAALHNTFLAALSLVLSPDQVIKVKDGMTYNVLSVTYNAYVDMIPSLNKDQKDQIMNWLAEAREHAMDAESSEKKHWWFGKYKGRINNYLSVQGYNINEERRAWEKRRSPKQSATN